MPETLPGWFSLPMLWLLAQACASAMSIRAFRFGVAPNVAPPNDGRVASDALGPLALAMPLIAAAFRSEWQIDGQSVAGWIALGAPIVCGLLALGAAAAFGGSASAAPALHSVSAPVTPSPVSLVSAAAWTFAGAVLLLLSAAHDLTIWVGQCSFAAGALMLWMNTPDTPRETPSKAESRANRALSIMLMCSAVQALAVGFVPASMLNVAGALAIAHAAMIVTLAAAVAGPSIAMRMGGWTATFGVLLGLGAISLRWMIPRAIDAMQTVAGTAVHAGRPPLRVAFGFGAFSLEAALMLALGAIAIGVMSIPAGTARRVIGAILILGAATLAGSRLATG